MLVPTVPQRVGHRALSVPTPPPAYQQTIHIPMVYMPSTPTSPSMVPVTFPCTCSPTQIPSQLSSTGLGYDFVPQNALSAPKLGNASRKDEVNPFHYTYCQCLVNHQRLASRGHMRHATLYARSQLEKKLHSHCRTNFLLARETYPVILVTARSTVLTSPMSCYRMAGLK